MDSISWHFRPTLPLRLVMLSVTTWLCSTSQIFAVMQLDQVNELSQSVGGLISVTEFTPAQVFTVGTEGTLAQIDLQIRRDVGALADAALEIWATSNGAPIGAGPLFSTPIPNADIPALPNTMSVPFTSIDVSAGNLQVMPGEQYMAAFRSFGEFGDPITSWAWGRPAYEGGDPYTTAFGQAWESEGSVNDFAFRTWNEVVSDGLINVDFETGNLTPWAPYNTSGGNTTPGFPRVESFDVTGDGTSSLAAKIRVGSNDPGFNVRPEGGGIEQEFSLLQGGDFRLSVDIAVALEQDFGNTGPGKFELLFDNVVVDTIDYNGIPIDPGEVFRHTLSADLSELATGTHSVAVQVLRNATNSREVYQYFDNISLVALDADFDTDDSVDGDDFLIWQQAFTTTPVVTGDADGDGIVGLADLSIWRSQFGESVVSAATAVPEPTGVSLILLAIGLMSGRKRRIPSATTH
ncbi:MAG: PEP-CTERM sorting domain-containing protein [Planctomycetota bacterium]